MNTSKWILCLGACALGLQLHAAPMESAFTYQGRLSSSGGQAQDGLYDFRFRLYDAETLGSIVGVTGDVIAVPVTNGLFTVRINFLASPFTTGEACWLELQVKTNGPLPLVTLAPRQRISPTPQAIYAGTASAVSWSGVTGLPTGLADGIDNDTTYTAGTGLTLSGTTFSVNPVFGDGRYWTLFGNSGTDPNVNFLGTTDNRAVVFKANNARAFRIEPSINSPNLIGGSAANVVTPGWYGGAIGGGGTAELGHLIDGAYGTIAGGIGNTIAADYASVGGGIRNRARADGATIGGGIRNTNDGLNSVIAGGGDNTIGFSSFSAIIGGGSNNVISLGRYSGLLGGQDNRLDDAYYSVIAGGQDNVINSTADYSAVGGGQSNIVRGSWATVPGGAGNQANFEYTFAAGRRAVANQQGTFVWADSTGADFTSTATNQFLIRAAGGVGINTNRPQQALHVNGGFALIEGNAHEQAYIGGDGFTGDVQIGSLNPAIVRVTLYNPATDGLMDLTGWVVEAAGAMRTPRVEVSQQIRVPGAGVGTTGPAFIHRATAANTAGHITTLNHPLCNGNPNAILTVTANFNPGGGSGVSNNHTLGVYYNGSRWTIFNQDSVAMIVNAAFNVLVINP